MKTRGAKSNSVSTSSWMSNWKREDKATSTPKFESFKDHKVESSNRTQGKANPQASKTRDTKYLMILVMGHIASKCLNRRTTILKDNGETESVSEEMPPL